MNSVIIVDNGVQDEEYIYPFYRLKEEGVVEVAVKDDSKMFYGKYGIPIKPTMKTSDLKENFDLVVIPGGLECPEKVRQDEKVLNFISQMNFKKKTIAAICHGPQVLISAKICQNRKMTCYKGMKDDLINAGAIYTENDVVVDENIITSPHYRNNPEFVKKAINVSKNNFIDYSNLKVIKPWGHECMVFQNDNVGIWNLCITPNNETSFHSHPNKKTGLIVLDGIAQVSLLGAKYKLGKNEKIMIHKGVFHSTKNIGCNNLQILEVETPNNKSDIIRMDDLYGRINKPYEEDFLTPNNEKIWDLSDKLLIGKSELYSRTFHNHNEIIDYEGNIIILSSNDESIISTGEIIDSSSIMKLINRFESILPIKIILVI